MKPLSNEKKKNGEIATKEERWQPSSITLIQKKNKERENREKKGFFVEGLY